MSWIPSEAVTGAPKLGFEAGVTHYDPPPPDVLDDVESLNSSDRFRFANSLRAWIEVADGSIVDHGQDGGLHIGVTNMQVAGRTLSIPAVGLPVLQPEPVVSAESVCFMQTVGGRTGAPLPRRISRPPYVRLGAPLVWTTLAVTLFADGRSTLALTGASPFPRHWVYDGSGALVAKSGLMDFKSWTAQSGPEQTPWGAEDSPAVVTAVETAVERSLSNVIMRGGAKPDIRVLAAGSSLVEQGAGARTSSCCSTGCSSPRWMARRWPNTGRARCWGSGRCSSPACGRRRCGR